MSMRSQLRHTAMGNGFAPLFEPHQREATRRVLTGDAAPDEFSGIRERLERWPAVSRAVEANLRAFEEGYTPFVDGLEVLRHKLGSEHWASLAASHGTRARDLLDIDRFVVEVRSAMSAFEKGLQAVGDGKMSVEQVGRLHAEMMDAYRKP
jgi:hypothetical protein